MQSTLYVQADPDPKTYADPTGSGSETLLETSPVWVCLQRVRTGLCVLKKLVFYKTIDAFLKLAQRA